MDILHSQDSETILLFNKVSSYTPVTLKELVERRLDRSLNCYNYKLINKLKRLDKDKMIKEIVRSEGKYGSRYVDSNDNK